MNDNLVYMEADSSMNTLNEYSSSSAGIPILLGFIINNVWVSGSDLVAIMYNVANGVATAKSFELYDTNNERFAPNINPAWGEVTFGLFDCSSTNATLYFPSQVFPASTWDPNRISHPICVRDALSTVAVTWHCLASLGSSKTGSNIRQVRVAVQLHGGAPRTDGWLLATDDCTPPYALATSQVDQSGETVMAFAYGDSHCSESSTTVRFFYASPSEALTDGTLLDTSIPFATMTSDTTTVLTYDYSPPPPPYNSCDPSICLTYIQEVNGVDFQLPLLPGMTCEVFNGQCVAIGLSQDSSSLPICMDVSGGSCFRSAPPPPPPPPPPSPPPPWPPLSPPLPPAPPLSPPPPSPPPLPPQHPPTPPTLPGGSIGWSSKVIFELEDAIPCNNRTNAQVIADELAEKTPLVDAVIDNVDSSSNVYSKSLSAEIRNDTSCEIQNVTTGRRRLQQSSGNGNVFVVFTQTSAVATQTSRNRYSKL